MAHASTESRPALLVVGADVSARSETRGLLTGQGFAILEAASGEEALKAAAKRPDAILLDVDLPDRSAFEVCAQLKHSEQTKLIPVFLVASQAPTAQAQEAAVNCGAEAVITQPIDAGLLAASVKAIRRARDAEREVIAVANTWQATFDAISHGVCIIGAEGIIQKANRAMYALVGDSARDLVGRGHCDLFDNVEAPPGGWAFDRVRATLQRASYELQVKDRWFHVAADPLFNEHHEFAGAVRTIVEITDSKRADEERDRLLRQIERERAHLEAVMRQIPAAVIMTEAPSGRVILRNAQVERILGSTHEDDSTLLLSYAPRRADGTLYTATDHPLARTIATGEIVTNEEMQFLRADGTPATVLVSSAPIMSREGEIVAALAMLHDVTDRYALENQLRQSQKMEAMGRLAGGVAHDFNNLLTIISGYSQMVIDALKPKDPMRDDLEAILEASNRASALTRQLLTFSRRQMVEQKVVDLNRQITKTSRMLQRVIGEDVTLDVSLAAKPARIKIDPSQLEQVLLNVAVNARDAMPQGGRLSIRTETMATGSKRNALPPSLKQGRYVMLVMSDTGTGMNAETLSHLFEPFYTTKAKGKGTGLGLSTVYGIVKQSGGEIAIASEVGKGTSVRIFLPLTGERVEAELEEPRRPGSKTGSGTETILVVEDEAEVRRLACEMLTRHGYTVIEAASGTEALEIWREHRDVVDMVLTDVIMPQMSGPQLVEHLKTLAPDVRVMYMSGYTDDILSAHGISETRSLLLHKPFTQTALARMVRTVLDRKDV